MQETTENKLYVKRSSNFELLRILAMLMIVACHAVQHSRTGNFSLMIEPFSVNVAANYLLGSYGQLGVILFVIVSSWFLCSAKSIHPEKVVRLYLQTMLCSVAVFVFVKLGGFEPVGFKELVKTFLTPIYGGYWFIRTYLFFYLLVPFLQDYVRKADEKLQVRLLAIMTILLPVFRFFFFVESEFGNVGDFIYVFIAVAYLKKKEGNYLEKYCRIIFAALLALMWSALFAANILCHRLEFSKNLTRNVILHIYSSRHIFIMLLAMSLFYIFKNHVKIGYSRIINTVANTTFGVYIFHENLLLHSYGENGLSETALLFEQWLHVGVHFETDKLYPLYLILCVFAVFTVCGLIEFLRRKLCCSVEYGFKKLLRR